MQSLLPSTVVFTCDHCLIFFCMRFESSNLNLFQPKDGSSAGGGIAGAPVNAVSVLFVLLSVLYIGFGLTLYCSERSPLVSAARREPLLEESKRSANDRLFLFWVALVIIVAVLLLSVIGIQRTAQNAANHQTHFELITCVIWSAAAWAIITVIGVLTLKARGHSTKLLTGTFYGCLVGYSVLSLVFAVYFAGAVSLFERSKNQCNPAMVNIVAKNSGDLDFKFLIISSLLSPSHFDKCTGLAQGLSGQHNNRRNSVRRHIARYWRSLRGLQQFHLHLSAFHHQGQCGRLWSPDGQHFTPIHHVNNWKTK